MRLDMTKLHKTFLFLILGAELDTLYSLFLCNRWNSGTQCGKYQCLSGTTLSQETFNLLQRPGSQSSTAEPLLLHFFSSIHSTLLTFALLFSCLFSFQILKRMLHMKYPQTFDIPFQADTTNTDKGGFSHFCVSSYKIQTCPSTTHPASWNSTQYVTEHAESLLSLATTEHMCNNVVGGIFFQSDL